MTEVPATASDHPASWKFHFPIYHPPALAAWRAWLAANGDTARGVWVASWRKASGRDAVAYEDLVEEAICFTPGAPTLIENRSVLVAFGER